MIDKDASFKYSTIEKVNLNGQQSVIRLHPNPIAPGNLLSISDEIDIENQNIVSIYTTMGERVLHIYTSDGKITLPPSISSGYYIVRINNQGAMPLIVSH